MPACAGICQHERASSPLRRSRYDSGSGHSLRSETPWFPRSRPPLAIRCPSATIRQDHSLSQAPVATPASLPRSHLRRLLPPLTACRLHFAPAPARRTRPLETIGVDDGYLGCAFPDGYAQTPLGLRCSLSSRRSRIFFQQSHTLMAALF
jgi:hypothetical protein